jgi:hypothetical protein
MDLVNVLVSKTCACAQFYEIRGLIDFIYKIIGIIQFGIPIILIILGMADLGKAVMAADEKEIKEAQKILGKRAISAIAVFFVIAIVKLIIGILPTDQDTSAFLCQPKDIPKNDSQYSSTMNACKTNQDYNTTY